jgi:hypothetical protein
MRAHHFAASLVLLLGFPAAAVLPDDLWFNPPGGTWVPGATIVSEMKTALDAALAKALATNSRVAGRPTKYWFQFRGGGEPLAPVIEILGHPGPVSPGAAQTYYNTGIPELCSVHARYSPITKKIEELWLGGNSCPPRI